MEMKRLLEIQGRLLSDCWTQFLHGSHHPLPHPASWNLVERVGQPIIGYSYDDSLGYIACRRTFPAATQWSVERLGLSALGTPPSLQLLAATYSSEARSGAVEAVGGSIRGAEAAVSSALLGSRGSGPGTSSNLGELDFAEVYLPQRSRLGSRESLSLNRGNGAPVSSGEPTGGDGALHWGTTSENKKPRSSRRQREMPPLLSATDAAVAHIKEIVSSYNERLQREEASGAVRRPRACGIRLSLKKQGCSGMAYDVAICTEGRADGSRPSLSAEGSASGKAGDTVPGEPRANSRRNKNWKEDEVIKVGEVEIRVAADAVMLLLGTQVDFVDEEVQTGFVFNNPNQKQSCGCGKSFMV